MKRTLAFSAVGLMMLFSVAQIYADIARPKTTASPEKQGKSVLYTSLTVTTDAKASDARLQISPDTLSSIRRALANQPADGSMVQTLTHSSTRTILAGLFLFLSISFAGVWLVRSGQGRTQKTVAGFLFVVAVLGAGAIITRANAGPPGYVRWNGLPKALSEGRATSGGVEVEIMPEGSDSGVKLIVPLRISNKPGEE